MPCLLIAVFILSANASRGERAMARTNREWWPNGKLQQEAQYRGESLNGTYRTWYKDGQPYEIKHYVDGHEQGLQ
jgi:hypothetical protein